MPWLRLGDNISTAPQMFRLLEVCQFDHALKNEAFGILCTAASVSAAHLEDYVVPLGLVATFAPGREKDIIDVLVAADLVERIKVDERHMLKIVEDPDFVHMRSKEEVEQDRNRAADKRKPGLIIAVRVRDGDCCRFCGRTVSWTDRVGTRAGTYDSLTNHKDSDVDNLVVACKGCNSKRKEGVELTLRAVPAPEEVYYSPSTISWINNHPYSQENGITVSDRQTRLDLSLSQAAATQAAAPAPSGATAPGSAAPASTPQPAGPRAELDGAPEWVTASLDEIKRQSNQAAATQAAHDGDPAAVGTDDVHDQAAATQAAAPATGGATAPGSAAPAGTPSDSPAALSPDVAPGRAAPDSECNETVKPGSRPRSDPGREGDGPRIVGTGRDGSGGDRSGEWSVFGQGRSRKRGRGRRSGRRRA